MMKALQSGAFLLAGVATPGWAWQCLRRLGRRKEWLRLRAPTARERTRANDYCSSTAPCSVGEAEPAATQLGVRCLGHSRGGAADEAELGSWEHHHSS
jgi:hypothetical protein